MAKYDSLLTKLAKDYNAIVNNNTLTFKSENDMTNAADDIANAFAFSLDFDTLTLEFINEAIDIQFIKDSLHLYANESKQNAIKAIMTSCGFANESDIEAVTAQLTDDKLQSKPNIAVDIANSLNNATVQSDNVSFITDGKIYLVKPIDSVELNESTTHVYGTMQFNAAQINAIKSLENDDSRRKFLTSMGIDDLDAESVAKNLELLKEVAPVNESSMKAFIDNKYYMQPKNLKENTDYTWYMGAEPLVCTYIGTNSKGYEFKLGKSTHTLSAKDVNEYIFAIEYMNESSNLIELEVSVRDASKANDAINDVKHLYKSLKQTSTNSWIIDVKDLDDLEDALKSANIKEYSTNMLNESIAVGTKLKFIDKKDADYGTVYTVQKAGLRSSADKLQKNEIYVVAPGKIGLDLDVTSDYFKNNWSVINESSNELNESHVHAVKFNSFDDAEKSANAKGVFFKNKSFKMLPENASPKTRYNIATLVNKSDKFLGIVKYNQETKLATIELEDNVSKDSVFDVYVNESSSTATYKIDRKAYGGRLASSLNDYLRAHKIDAEYDHTNGIVTLDVNDLGDDKDMFLEILTMINESGVAYQVQTACFTNPWLTHKVRQSDYLRGYQFGNAFNDCVVNADTIDGPQAVYVNESNEISYAQPIPMYISEAGKIETDEQFKQYAEDILKAAHGDDYDAKIANKTIDDLLQNYKDNYGAMVGALTSGFGNESSKFDQEEALQLLDDVKAILKTEGRSFNQANVKDVLKTCDKLSLFDQMWSYLNESASDNIKIANKVAAYIKQYNLSDKDAKDIFDNLSVAAKLGSLNAYSATVLDQY